MSIELLIALGIGLLTAAALHCLMRGKRFDVILGLALLSHAVNLFLFAMGRPAPGKPPIVAAGTVPTLAQHVDPLPQALVLTAIVIGFAMTGLVAALTVRRRHSYAQREDGDE